MNIRNVALLSVVAILPFGLGALLVPAQLVALYGVELSDAGLVMARLFGVHVLMIAIVDWFARNELRGAGESGAHRGIVAMNIISPTLSMLLILAATLSGTINALGWANVAILVGLAAAWIYVAMLRAPAAAAT